MNKYIIYISLILLVATACGKSSETKKIMSKEERMEQHRQDSLALKVGVTPTLDCLPIFVAKEKGIFESDSVEVHIRLRNSHLDLDTLLAGGYVEGCATERVRAKRIIDEGTALEYVAQTNLSWQLITNRLQRIKKLSQLADKMIAMTRFSATDSLADIAIGKSRVKDGIFKIQINDVKTRLHMLLNNEMDAMFLPEPQATTARLHNHNVVEDSLFSKVNVGVVAFRKKALEDRRRQQQLKAFVKAYNTACDSINRYGMQSYADVIAKYTGADNKTVSSLPDVKFKHAE